MLDACLWKAASLLFWRSKLAYERPRISRNMASVAELKKSFFAQFDTVDAAESFNFGVVGSSEFGVEHSTLSAGAHRFERIAEMRFAKNVRTVHRRPNPADEVNGVGRPKYGGSITVTSLMV